MFDSQYEHLWSDNTEADLGRHPTKDFVEAAYEAEK